MLTVNFKKINPNAYLPTYGTEDAAGLDLYALEGCWLSHGSVHLVRTGLAIEIPKGYEGQVRPRSSMGLRGVIIPNSPGTIDADYRGEISVELMALVYPVHIQAGDRIAQLVIAPVTRVDVREGELSATVRGEKGYGSTGR